MTLLICPVRPGEVNEELRYALRSWETNLHLRGTFLAEDILELMVVGHCPSWLEPDHFVKGNVYSSMPKAVFDNVKIGAERASEMGEIEVIYMNDDFFCLDPVGAILPVKRHISLAKHVEVARGKNGSWWGVSLDLTASWLSEVGFPHPDSYEVHRPLLASPAAMFDTLSRWDLASTDVPPQWRTMYGVLNEIDAYPVIDAKLGGGAKGVGTPWVSTSDATWRVYGKQIAKRFQKPSRWER